MLSGVILDLDGTLVDSNECHVQAWVRAFARHGYQIPADRIRPEIGKGGDNLVPAILGPSAEAKDGEALRESVGALFPDVVAERGVRAYDGVLELIDALKARGLKVALATSSSMEHLAVTLERAGLGAPDGGPLRDRLDALVNKDDVEASKPEPDVVVAAVRKLGLSPAECVMVGDTPYDAIAARRAGVVTLGVTCGGIFDEKRLIAGGARRVWRDPAHLLAELDDVLHDASPTRVRLTGDVVESLMREALAVAESALANGEAPIGCVIADGDGTIRARAHNTMNATQRKTAHAEIVAFERLADAVPLDARDLIMVSTLEPCVMCTGAAMEAAVDTIVYALQAPADSGTGRVRPPESPESQMPRIVGDVCAGESRRLFERWLEANGGTPQAAYVEQLMGLVKSDAHGTRERPREAA